MLIVVLLAMLTTAGIQVLRLVLDEKRHRRNGEGCRLDDTLARAMRLAIDRQPAYAQEAARDHEEARRDIRDLKDAIQSMTTALTRLTERLIDEAARRRP